MPLIRTLIPDVNTKILIWKISETFDQLFSEINLNQKSLTRLQNMKSIMHQCGFLSVRKLLQEAGYSDFELIYDESGKPHLTSGKHISISHSYEMSAIIISEKPVGIDLEIQKEKVLKIAPRFMNISHLKNLNFIDKIKKATIVWGTKEVVFKIENQKTISFPNHIFEDEFQLSYKKLSAQLKFKQAIKNYEIYFDEIENYLLVWGFEKFIQ